MTRTEYAPYPVSVVADDASVHGGVGDGGITPLPYAVGVVVPPSNASHWRNPQSGELHVSARLTSGAGSVPMVAVGRAAMIRATMQPGVGVGLCGLNVNVPELENVLPRDPRTSSSGASPQPPTTNAVQFQRPKMGGGPRPRRWPPPRR